jgi:hypothetical protein
VAGTDVSAFIGEGAYWLDDGQVNPQATGLVISDIDLGLALFTGGLERGKFAFSGLGGINFAGLDGLNISQLLPDFGLALNRTGAAISNLQIPGLTAPGGNPFFLNFVNGSDAPVLQGGVTIGYPGVFELDGVLSLQRLPTGEIVLGIPAASLVIYSGSDEAFRVSGSASFKVGGVDGFRLEDFRLNQVAIFGQNLPLAGVLSPLRCSPIWPDPATGGLIDRSVLSTRHYIDVLFRDVNRIGIDGDSIVDGLAPAPPRPARVRRG